MTERRGTKALELWCRRITDGYPGVNVQNMTTSWRDGLAFCAMIHHFRPDLIDFNSLNKDDVYGNNELAFRTAAEHLGIPALLDAEDMASCSVPDRLSILTYLSQFYQNFGGSSPSRLALSRTKESSKEGITPVSPTTPTKPKMGPRTGMRREPCAACGMPVFLAEKLLISRTPYHRTCFRCARCSNQLTPGNYYETEEGQYCCETCPDEEPKSVSNPVLHQAYNEAVVLNQEKEEEEEEDSRKNSSFTVGYQRASLSDEEKTERIHERGIPRSTADDIRRLSLVAEKMSHSAQMRLNFMTKNLLEDRLDDESNDSSSVAEDDRSESEEVEEDDKAECRADSSPPGGSFRNRRGQKGSPRRDLDDGDGRVEAEETPSEVTDDLKTVAVEQDVDKDGSGASVAPAGKYESGDLDDRLEDKEDRIKESFGTAASEARRDRHRKSNTAGKEDSSDRQDAKDTLGPEEIDAVADSRNQCLSLVQRRLRIFENSPIEERKISSLPMEKNLVKKSSVFTGDKEIGEATSENDVDSRTIEETDKSSGMIGEIDRSINEEEKSSDLKTAMSVTENESGTSLPPIVPKRTAPELRKAGKFKKRDPEITVLNARGIDLSAEENYPRDLNPFGSDEEEGKEEKSIGNFETSRSGKVSTNPFGSSDEGEDDDAPKIVAPPRPAARTTAVGNKWREEGGNEIDDEAPTKRRLKAPQINLNPFWSDDDENHESDDECAVNSLTSNTPVPKPRTIKQSSESFLSQRKNDLHRGDIYASNSSLGSTGSASTPGGTYRKKKPAPPPPIANELFASGADSMLSPNRGLNTFTGSNNSLRTTPRARKAKPAPPPPMPTSTPRSADLIANLTLTESPITDSGKIIESRDYETWDDQKIGKDEANRSKQSMTTISCDETNPYGGYTDKSVQGKWKRKKGPAPARPIPHRRKIKVMSLKDVKLELDEIEMQQQGLEKQGVRLEQLIRDKAESGNATEETSLEIDVEELVLELFALVNEKNELFRRQAELMLLRRQQRLEEEHADIEYQIRCLLCQPEATKTDFDKQREETLIQRLVDIVERRNEIVECLEMDRRREVEEDRSINTRMGLYAAKTKGDFAKELEDDENNRSRKSKKTKLKEKAKEKILRKVHKKDADKDVDEAEVKLKRQNKRKWF